MNAKIMRALPIRIAMLALMLLSVNGGWAQSASTTVILPAQFIDALTDTSLTGHYQDPETAYINHYIKWESLLDGKVIRQAKKAPEVNFEMETWLFVDQPGHRNAFIQISNRGTVSKGEFAMKDGKLWLEGKTFEGEKMIRHFRQSYEISDSGELVDCFYRFTNDKWTKGHEIHYSDNSKD